MLGDRLSDEYTSGTEIKQQLRACRSIDTNYPWQLEQRLEKYVVLFLYILYLFSGVLQTMILCREVSYHDLSESAEKFENRYFLRYVNLNFLKSYDLYTT